MVVVSFNSRDLLPACVGALATELAHAGLPTAATVWLVDNASADGSADWVRQHCPGVQVVALTDNRGFTAANNVILAPWSTDPDRCPETVLLLNPDTEIRPGALRTMLDALAAQPTLAVVGPALVYADGRFQHAGFRFPGLVQTWLDLVPIDRLVDSRVNGRYGRRCYAAGEPFPVDFVLGACMLVRGTALAAVGPLDEGFYMYCEEIDWCRRFRAAGWGVACVPQAVVLHHGGASTRQLGTAMFVQLWRSRQRDFARHAGPARRAAFATVLRTGLAVRAWRDRRAVARGRLGAAEGAARAAAYARVLTAPGP